MDMDAAVPFETQYAEKIQVTWKIYLFCVTSLGKNSHFQERYFRARSGSKFETVLVFILYHVMVEKFSYSLWDEKILVTFSDIYYYQLNMSDQEVLVLRGTLEGHNGWVTSLATTPTKPDLLLSGSRDKTLIAWKLTGGEDNQYGVPKKSFIGHSHIVQDVTISADGAYALSGSWDKTLRLWDLETGESTKRFDGHTGDVLSVSIASNLRQIVSASRDKTVKVWNTIGECMQTLSGHKDWVSAVRFSPDPEVATVISASWDKTVKVCFLSYFFCGNMMFPIFATSDGLKPRMRHFQSPRSLIPQFSL